jgi:phage replication-related protein YjqB (UPF0714/DUF867 family)
MGKYTSSVLATLLIAFIHLIFWSSYSLADIPISAQAGGAAQTNSELIYAASADQCPQNIEFGTLGKRKDTFGCFQDDCPKPLLGSGCIAPLHSHPVVDDCEGIDMSQDWNTCINDRGSDVTVLSIHGGFIESQTSKIGRDLAKGSNWNYYDFNGHVRNDSCEKENCSCGGGNFCLLHIKSKNFNDSDALDLVAAHPKAVSIHGCSPSCSIDGPDDDSPIICVGGQNKPQRDIFKNFTEFCANVRGLTLNVEVPENYSQCDTDIAGLNSSNIVNMTSGGQGGLQLEFSPGIRDQLSTTNPSLMRGIVFSGIQYAMSGFDPTNQPDPPFFICTRVGY